MAAAGRDTTFRWFLVLYFLLNFGQGVFPPVLPAITTDLRLSFLSAGLLGTAFGLARFLVDLPVGLFVERVNPAGILHAGVGLLLLGTLISARADSFVVMLLGRGVLGVGSAMSIIFSLLYVMRTGPVTWRTRRGNIYEVAVMGGIAASAALGGWVAVWVGWRWSFAMAALAIAAGWLVGARRVLPGARGVLSHPEGPLPITTDGTPAISRAVIITIGLTTFSLTVGWAGGISTLLPLYGGQELHLTPEVVGGALAVAYGVEVCLLLPVGWASDVFGRVRVMVPGLLVMLAGILVLPHTETVVTYGLACILVSAGMTVWMIPPALLAERLRGRFHGRAAGQLRFMSDLGYFLAPGAIGWLIDRGGFRVGAVGIAIVLGASVCASLTALRGPLRTATLVSGARASATGAWRSR